MCSGFSASASVGSSTPMAVGESSPDAGSSDYSGVGARLRAGGIVLRRGCEARQPEVLLVSRRRAPGSFTVPAGKFEHDIDSGSFEACALRETEEEAGLECSIMFDLGWYKGLTKDHQETRTRFFAMHLVREMADWSEESERIRVWKGLDEAQRLTEYSPMLGQVFRQLVRELGERKEGSESLWSEPAFQSTKKGGSGSSSSSGKKMRRSVSAASMSSDDSDAMNQLLAALPETETLADAEMPVCAAAPVCLSMPACTTVPEEQAPEDESAALVAERERSESAGSGKAMSQQDRTRSSGSVVSQTEGSAGAAQGERKQVMSRVNSGSVSRKVSMEEASNLQIEDCDGERFCFYSNQVGGHFCLVKPAPESSRIFVTPNAATMSGGAGGGGNGVCRNGQGQLELPAQGVVLKPLEKREHRFYIMMINEVPAFFPHMPQLFGTKTLSMRQVTAMTAEVDKLVKNAEENFLETRMRSHQFQSYIVMEDLAGSMQRPRILDLKMGFKQRSKHHSQRKRERCRMKAATSTSHALGFRICGLSTERKVYDKYWGRKLPLSGMLAALSEYFLHEEASQEQRQHVITGFLTQVARLRELVSQLPRWRFWNTSLLFLFDGGDLSAEPTVRMIDFAHCTRVRGTALDSEFLCGLRNVEAFLEAVRDGHPFDRWIQERLADPPTESVQDAEEMETDEESEETSRCAGEAGLEGIAETPAVAAAG